ASRLPNTPRTRLASRKPSNAITASSAKPTRVHLPLRRGRTACSNHSSSTWCRKMFERQGETAPRTQKITLRDGHCSVRTAVDRCHGQRDAVPDDDLVIAHEDFLDEKPQDALAFQYVEGPRRRPQSRKERGQRFSEAQVGCAVD